LSKHRDKNVKLKAFESFFFFLVGKGSTITKLSQIGELLLTGFYFYQVGYLKKKLAQIH
jgi:hypothetical protein